MELDFDQYKAQQFCDNPECQYYSKTGEDNIRTHSRQHQQVYCNSCKSIWVITKGTFFYNLKAPVSLVLEVLRLLSEGMGLRAVCRTKEVTPDAVGSWLLKAAKHVHEVTIYLERAMHLTQCQIDEFWSYILKKSPAQRRRTRARGLGRSMDVCQRPASQWVDSYGASWETDQGRGRAICPDDQKEQ
jgi:transposase-like protein